MRERGKTDKDKAHARESVAVVSGECLHDVVALAGPWGSASVGLDAVDQL